MTEDARLDRIEGDIADLKRDVAEIKSDVAGLKREVAEIKSTLARLEPMILRILEMQARLEGRIADMPTARDFGRLEGQVEEMARRLPIPLAYTPPEEKRRA